MDRPADNLEDAQCAERLRQQWPRADPTSLQEAARELWRDEGLRVCEPQEAAVMWLRKFIPIGPDYKNQLW